MVARIIPRNRTKSRLEEFSK